MTSTLANIALRRLNCWVSTPSETNEVFTKVLKLELGQIGYTLKSDNLEVICTEEYKKRLDLLTEKRGGDVWYVPLFTNFPDELPNDTSYLIQRILGFFGINTFAKKDFGANPITQRQEEEIYQEAVSQQKQKLSDDNINWIELNVLSIDEAKTALSNWLASLLYANTSIQETLWDDIFAAIVETNFEVNYSNVSFKETLVRLSVQPWLATNNLNLDTPTDILRLLACIQGQDISLASKIVLKGLRFSKPQRRAILGFLNSSTNLEEDLLRYKALWVSISNRLHPGDYVKQFPKVVQAFDDLRNNRIKSFNSKVLNSEFRTRLELLKQRPGVFLRNLSLLSKETDGENHRIADALLSIDPSKFQLTTLITTYAALKYDGERLVINKKGKPYNIDSRGFDIHYRVTEAVETILLSKLNGLCDWKSVYIDPAAYKIVLPLQIRKQSEGSLVIARGSRLKLSDCKVLRVFLYWQQLQNRTDIDLSVLFLNKDVEEIKYVSFSDYGDGIEAAHSGDITSAPYGAAEFIDINLKKIDAASKYLVPSVLRYGGDEFVDLVKCYSGWMERNNIDRNIKTFDIGTVVSKVSVNGDGMNWVPFIYEVETSEIIWVDLYSKGSRVIQGNKHFPKQVKAISQFSDAKPTFGLLASLYAEANAIEVLTDKKTAKVTVGVDDTCTINVVKLFGENALKLVDTSVNIV